jgi:hypothetical protein
MEEARVSFSNKKRIVTQEPRANTSHGVLT